MISETNPIVWSEKWFAAILFLIALPWFSFDVQAQRIPEKPPRPIDIEVRTEQNLRFGSFTYAVLVDGTVTITPAGARSATNVYTSGAGYSAAWIQVKGHRGTLVTMLVQPSSIVSGTNHMDLTFPTPFSIPNTPFIITENDTWQNVFIGGQLTVKTKSFNPEGYYQGTFQVTFIQN